MMSYWRRSGSNYQAIDNCDSRSRFISACGSHSFLECFKSHIDPEILQAFIPHIGSMIQKKTEKGLVVHLI